MKKTLALLLSLALVFGLFAFGTTAFADDVEYTEIALQLSHHNAVDQPIGVALDKFAELMNERSGGKVVITVYPAASYVSC